jgi:hypothetical protein
MEEISRLFRCPLQPDNLELSAPVSADDKAFAGMVAQTDGIPQLVHPDYSERKRRR